MPFSTFEGTVKNGQIHLRDKVTLVENTRVYVLIADSQQAPTAGIYSPRLAHPEQAADFTKQIIEVSPNAGV